MDDESMEKLIASVTNGMLSHTQVLKELDALDGLNWDGAATTNSTTTAACTLASIKEIAEKFKNLRSSNHKIISVDDPSGGKKLYAIKEKDPYEFLTESLFTPEPVDEPYRDFKPRFSIDPGIAIMKHASITMHDAGCGSLDLPPVSNAPVVPPEPVTIVPELPKRTSRKVII